MISFETMSVFHKEQIHYLQRAIWDLEKAAENIKHAICPSDLGEVYLANIEVIKDDLQEDIDNIHAEYDTN